MKHWTLVDVRKAAKAHPVFRKAAAAAIADAFIHVSMRRQPQGIETFLDAPGLRSMDKVYKHPPTGIAISFWRTNTTVLYNKHGANISLVIKGTNNVAFLRITSKPHSRLTLATLEEVLAVIGCLVSFARRQGPEIVYIFSYNVLLNNQKAKFMSNLITQFIKTRVLHMLTSSPNDHVVTPVPIVRFNRHL